jgi:tRNA/rRNA methyltransferase
MVGPVILLVRPQLPENIGMCARAMANFGLDELRLIAPREGWPQKARLKKGAYSAAAGATAILDRARLFPDLAEGIADLSTLYVGTARERGQAKRIVGPEAAMRESHAAISNGERVGIAFGPERAGLTNDEIALGSAILTYPVDPAFPSLNLAQAVLLAGYEWFCVSQGARLPFTTARTPPASRETLLAFFAFVEEELIARRFFWPEEKRPVMIRNFRNLILRLDPNEQDLRSLRGAIRYLIGRDRPREGGTP